MASEKSWQCGYRLGSYRCNYIVGADGIHLGKHEMVRDKTPADTARKAETMNELTEHSKRADRGRL